MNINPIANSQNFEGKVIIKDKLSKPNNSLLSIHKSTLDNMIKDLPFDLFLKQSNKNKIITFSTNVEGANVYQVYKRKNNFLEAVGNAVSDAMGKSEAYKKLVKANEILWYVKLHIMNVILGKFKEAREMQKNIAKLGVENFELYKDMTNFELTGFPREMNKIILFNSIKYKCYNLFTPKTKEEKQLRKMNKAYIKEMKAKNIEKKPTKIDLSEIYY